jgi:hypothetical protein
VQYNHGGNLYLNKYDYYWISSPSWTGQQVAFPSSCLVQMGFIRIENIDSIEINKKLWYTPAVGLDITNKN